MKYTHVHLGTQSPVGSRPGSNTMSPFLKNTDFISKMEMSSQSPGEKIILSAENGKEFTKFEKLKILPGWSDSCALYSEECTPGAIITGNSKGVNICWYFHRNKC